METRWFKMEPGRSQGEPRYICCCWLLLQAAATAVAGWCNGANRELSWPKTRQSKTGDDVFRGAAGFDLFLTKRGVPPPPVVQIAWRGASLLFCGPSALLKTSGEPRRACRFFFSIDFFVNSLAAESYKVTGSPLQNPMRIHVETMWKLASTPR